MLDITYHEREQAGFWHNAAERQAAQGNQAIALMFRNEAFILENGDWRAHNTFDAKPNKT